MNANFIQAMVEHTKSQRTTDKRFKPTSELKIAMVKKWRESSLNSKEFDIKHGFTEGTIRRWTKSVKK